MLVFIKDMLNFIIENKKIYTDLDGYLKNSNDWNKYVAQIIADKENIILSSEHWEVIMFIRNFYIEFNSSPSIRLLVNYLTNKFGNNKGNSRYLYRLFPKGPAKQATKIAGLPRLLVRCI